LQTQIKIKLTLILEFTIGLSLLAASATNTLSTSFSTDAFMNSEITNTNSTETVVIEEKVAELEQSNKTTKEIVTEYFSDTPVLADVAYCESRFTHFNTDGSVLRGRVNRADVGVMQINEKYHAATAVKLGIDLYTLEGNMAYARYLYDTQGTRPWVHSSPCWNTIREVALAN
jgi:hypothetical protein